MYVPAVRPQKEQGVLLGTYNFMAQQIEIDMFDEGEAESVPLLLEGQLAETQIQKAMLANVQMTLSGEPNEEISFAV